MIELYIKQSQLTSAGDKNIILAISGAFYVPSNTRKTMVSSSVFALLVFATQAASVKL